MIYTLTLNPSIDYIVSLENLQVGGLNRTAAEAKFPGGKGINVSRILLELGVPSTTAGFIGGFTGNYLNDYLIEEGIATDFIQVEEDTRINIKIKSDNETEINGQGPDIPAEKIHELEKQLERLGAVDILVLAGSIPSTLPNDIYQALIEKAISNGAEVVVDVEGHLLKSVLSYKPLLIKPNHHELGQYFGTEIFSHEQAIYFGRKLVEEGAKNVIVSLAGKGAVFVNNECCFIATVPDGEVKSSVGSGDSMVAGFLASLHKGRTLEEAFTYSVAAGSATAFSIGLASKEQIEQLTSHVKITSLE